MKPLTFRKMLGLLAVIYAGIILAGTVCFWLYLRRYETTHPVGAMNAYFDDLQHDRRDTILRDCAFPFDTVNTQEVYWQYLLQKYNRGENAWQYAERSATADVVVYDVYANDQRYGTLTLEKQHDGWRVHSDWAYAAHMQVVSSLTPSYNGIPLETVTDGLQTPVPAFAGAGGIVPTTRTYTFATLCAGTVGLTDGTAAVKSLADGTVQVTAQPNEADDTALRAFAEQAARVYAAYISNDAPLSTLTAMAESGTPFSKNVRAYSNYWYNKHTGIAFENMQVDAPVMWSADAFTVDVAFDFVVKRTHDSHTYPTKYRIACRRKGAGFAVTNIQPQ